VDLQAGQPSNAQTIVSCWLWWQTVSRVSLVLFSQPQGSITGFSRQDDGPVDEEILLNDQQAKNQSKKTDW
jgi:hypothetical protein